MTNFKVIALAGAMAKEIRELRRDEFGNEAEASIAGENGYGPCRVCLEQFKPNDTRLLFAFSPNSAKNPYRESGPVFIHQKTCQPFAEANILPPQVMNGKTKIPLVFRAYNDDERMIGAEFANQENAAELLADLFKREAVNTVHIRNAQFGCFIAKIERE